jgi:dTDP-glucose pyrophosphorylase
VLVDFKNNLITENLKLSDAIVLLNDAALKILFIVRSKNRLIGTLTDGDIRRATISGHHLSETVSVAMNKSFTFFDATANPFFIEEVLFRKDLVAIPILSKTKEIINVHSLHDFSKTLILNNKAIIMAGGFGKRLGHLTQDTPKPMLKIGKKPIILLIIENLKKYGFKDFIISLHYLPEKIMEFLGDGSSYGINIEYIIEPSPLGTAGALFLVKDKGVNGSNLVINSDVITEINYINLIEQHLNIDSSITICTREYTHRVPYGVVMTKNNKVTSIEEKPSIKSNVSAGVYLINFDHLENRSYEKYQDMPDLVREMISSGKKVSQYQIDNYWIDIGQVHDYERAQLDFINNV